MPTSLLPHAPWPTAPTPSTPHLPLELIWAIIEHTLVQLSHGARGNDNNITIPIHLITLNRVIHALILKLVYRTVILSSSRAVAKFRLLLVNSANIASLVQNLWIGTPRLEAFIHQVGWIPCAVKRILDMTKNIRRLALPVAFYPIGLGEVPLNHLTVNGRGLTDLPGEMNTLHIYGLIQSDLLRRSAATGLRRVVCEFRRPCPPGAVARFIRDLMTCEEMKLKLDLVVPPGLEAWLNGELAEMEGSFPHITIQARLEGEGPVESPAEEWARKCRVS